MLKHMDVWTVVRIATWAVGLPVIVWLTWRAARTWKRIQALHEQLLREEEQRNAATPRLLSA
ncbi:MAG: hypothetical protein ACOVT5_08485, partial [Armatimonadaceae bacterium]